MLKDVQKKYGEVFENYFKSVFEDGVEVKCNWGFPVVGISLTSKSDLDGSVSLWSFLVNVIDEKYDLSVRSFKVEEEKEISLATNISEDLVKFIVNKTIEISSSFFQTPNEEGQENQESQESQESQEATQE